MTHVFSGWAFSLYGRASWALEISKGLFSRQPCCKDAAFVTRGIYSFQKCWGRVGSGRLTWQTMIRRRLFSMFLLSASTIKRVVRYFRSKFTALDQAVKLKEGLIHGVFFIASGDKSSYLAGVKLHILLLYRSTFTFFGWDFAILNTHT